MVGDIAGLKDNTGALSVYTNEKGGIIDDTVITKVCCDNNEHFTSALPLLLPHGHEEAWH